MKLSSSPILNNLKNLGYKLPKLSSPLASYVPAQLWQGSVFVSGQLPLVDGNLIMEGVMDKKRDIEEGKRAMAFCFLNGIAAAATKVDVDKIKGVLRLGAYIASAPDFFDQHLVANGASDLALSLFGEAGRHTRFAIGVHSLPIN